MDDKRPFHSDGTYLTEEEMRRLARKRQNDLMYEATFKKFREIWLVRDCHIEEWVPHGEKSIFIRFKNNEVFIFTYYDKEHWKIDFEKLSIVYADGTQYMMPPLKGDTDEQERG
jgi:hypothetical protein